MEGEIYWYYLDGRLKQHISPPIDPSTVTFITIRLSDIGYKKVRAEVIACVEGKYLKPKIFTSSPYDTPKQFREMVEEYVKKYLTEQRKITDWTDINYRKKMINNKKPTKRRKRK
jgi:hypothetical protein